ncbi:TonB-linked SusC/RagA family outer membrane protein [Mucilaginibacter gracilis]|uniref:TonB-linked SusC/RagA family outer membrane protein n=1 Tax=Mucilaginibacter gracilis TaxID=423350 RepID=A0A495J1X0_9SPHI|nr:SusC/RagA family TonB-linked outer membrane protein [Mucilaginibacter gracilis]RKR82927.1 TonB-linked SusC/RagA family outer membrane protein [Mucilaginibacter gracilis]
MQLNLCAKVAGIKRFFAPQIIKVMKLTVFIITLACLQVSAKVYSQINLSEKNAPLSKVISTIQQQSGYSFFYKHKLIENINVSAELHNVTLQQALDNILTGQSLTYEVIDKTVVIKQKEKSLIDKVTDVLAVPFTISGKVTDTTGTPLPGATILAKGSNKVAVSNNNGEFSIDVQVGDVLIISYVGYKPVTVTVPPNSPANIPYFNIILHSSSSKLQEVVVSTGYQNISKERASGAFGKPDMQTFSERTGSNDIVSRLDGLVPGLTVLNGPTHVTVNPNGNGASQQQSVIRGRSSISLVANPLYVIDGIQVTDFSAINPDDVADITVLKDAAATAIWGAKAANGVIVVVTKKGGNHKVKVNYSGYFNYQGKPNFDYVYRHELSSSQYIQAAKEIFDPVTYPYATLSTQFVAPHETILYNLGLISVAKASASLDSLSNIDNKSQVENLWFRNAYTMQHTVSASGGNNNYDFYSSISYTDNNSNTIGSKNNAYRIFLSQNITPNSWIKIGLTTSLNNTITSSARPISIGAAFLPYQIFQDGSGNNILLNYVQGLTAATRADYQARSRTNLDYSPLDEMNSGYTKTNNLTINTTADVAVKLWKGLSFEGTYGYSKAPGGGTSYDDISEYSQRRELLNFTVAPTTASVPVYNLPNTGGRYQTIANDQRNWTVRNQLLYTTDPRNGKDHLNIQIGQEAQEQLATSNTSTVRGYNTMLNTYSALNYATLSTVTGAIGSGFSQFTELPFTYTQTLTRFTSYFGLLSYEFNHKYIFNGSIRADHSNLFGDDVSGQKKPAYSVGGKWQVYQESFMKNVDWVKGLALRATYGVTGNSPFVGSGSLVDILAVVQNTTTGNGLVVGTYANNKLSWETTHTFNIGVDYSVLNHRLNGSIDLYQKNTTDLLGPIQLDPLSGTATTTGNLGNLRNRGIELSLQSLNLKFKNFSWSTNFVFSYNNNKLLSYTNPTAIQLTDSFQLSTAYAVGYSTPSLFAYKFAGLDNLGDPQIQLANGTITKKPGAAKANDMVYMGSTLPVYNGGLTNTFRYKQFSLTGNLAYSFGAVMRSDVNTFYTGRLTGTAGAFSGNISSDFANRWKVPGDEATTNIPSYVANQGTSNTRRNVLYYEDADINVVSASYVKLRDITLGYNLSPAILQMLRISSFRVFVQAGNFMVWKANRNDIDPEYNIGNGISRPLPAYGHTYSAGISASF